MTEPTRVIPMPTPGRQRRGVLAPVLGLIGVGICGLVVVGLVSTSVGPAGAVVGTLCALLPVGPVVATFLWIDRWEPEPPRILLFAFLWGACVAALGALLINSSASVLAEQALGTDYGALLGAVVVAPVVEETIKGLFLLGMLIFRRREFDGVVDGIVYGGLVAAGFAFSENILYLGRAFIEDAGVGQLGSVLTVLVLRGVVSPFAHPLFTVMIGIGAGIAARTNSRAVQIGAVAIGFVVAVGVHSLWNASASVLGGGLFLVVYGFVMVPVFLALVAVVVWQRRREQRTVAAQLPGFAAAGWIVPSEVPLLASMAGRQGWRSAVRKRSGRKVAKAVAEYQAAVTELAFLRARMERGTVGATGPLWHAEAVDEIRRARARVVGHPEALTVAIRNGPQGWSPPSPGPPPGPPPPAPPGMSAKPPS